MDELHPLFRNDIPSTGELRSNDVYSALVEISSQKEVRDIPEDLLVKPTPKEEREFCKVSVSSRTINKVVKLERNLKGKYQRHLSKVKETKSRLEAKKLEKALQDVKESRETPIMNNSDEKELAEMEICMSLWSNKNLFPE
ncbi:hypothetical protein HWI79_3072 [Cryptosporidium felis]|nr:hypothetical protein HWI79_3072 [Cryptosporidium felis]